MAQLANTYETYDTVGIREELADKIHQITPEETPFLSLIGRKKCRSTHPEWQTDTLDAVDADNNQPEGNEWQFTEINPTARVGNYCQISDKKIIISASNESSNAAGRRSELARETAKKGVALRIDMEIIALSNQASSAGSGNAASNRKLGGLRAWLSTNDSLGSSGASGGFNSGTGLVDAATNGSQRAFTKALLDANILSVYNAGGSPTTCMMSPYAKTVFSTFMADSNVIPLRRQVSGKQQGVIIAAADVYVSDFGDLLMIPNRQMARGGAAHARNVFQIDPTKIHLKSYRDIKRETPAKTGDSHKRVLVTEYTLCVDNEAAHGVIADIYGMSASS